MGEDETGVALDLCVEVSSGCVSYLGILTDMHAAQRLLERVSCAPYDVLGRLLGEGKLSKEQLVPDGSTEREDETRVHDERHRPTRTRRHPSVWCAAGAIVHRVDQVCGGSPAPSNSANRVEQ